MGRGAGRHRRESRLRDGQAGGDAGGGFTTHRARQSAARSGRLEAAVGAAEKKRGGGEHRRNLRAGEIGRGAWRGRGEKSVGGGSFKKKKKKQSRGHANYGHITDQEPESRNIS